MIIYPYIRYANGQAVYIAIEKRAGHYAYGCSHGQAIANLLGVLALQ